MNPYARQTPDIQRTAAEYGGTHVPYEGRRVVANTQGERVYTNQYGEPLEVARGSAMGRDGRLASTSGYMLDSQGNINAWDKRDMINRQAAMLQQAQQGNIRLQRRAQVTVEDKQEWARMCQAAVHSKDGLQVLGEVLSDEVWETMNRDGLVRHLLAIKNLQGGETARVRVRKKDVVAYMATTAASITEVMINQDYIYPKEVFVKGGVTIDERTLQQASTDLLDEKYQDMLEAVGVREDRLFKFMLDLAAPTFNNLTSFVTYTPGTMATLMNQVGGWNLPTATMLVAYDILQDMRADPDWTAWYDPVSKHQLVMEGYLGNLMGVEMIIDGFRYENLRVLNPGEVYMLTTPVALGTFTQREQLKSQAIDRYSQFQAKRGWFLFEIISLTCANPRGVAKATRL
jgi:hypothetical protein